MKTKIFFSLFGFLLYPAILFSQNSGTDNPQLPAKNQLGIQVNPIYNHSAASFKDFVFSFRYGYKISKPVTIGAEISTISPNRFSNSVETRFHFNRYLNKIGIFARYTFLADKRIQPFLEIAPYYMDTTYEGNPWFDYPTLSEWEFRERGMKLYVAPGISLYSKNKKFSLDLMFKLPIPTKGFNEQPDFSYKFNFHF